MKGGTIYSFHCCLVHSQSLVIGIVLKFPNSGEEGNARFLSGVNQHSSAKADRAALIHTN